MTLGLTALELARIQFAFTVSFHIIFPAISIGLSQLSGHSGMALVQNPKSDFSVICSNFGLKFSQWHSAWVSSLVWS